MDVLKIFVELHPQAFPAGANLKPEVQQDVEAQLTEFLRNPGRRFCFLPAGLRVHVADLDDDAMPQVIEAREMPQFGGLSRVGDN